VIEQAMMSEIARRIQMLSDAQQHMRSGKPFMTTGQFSRSQLIDITDREMLQLTWALGLLKLGPGTSEDERYEAGRAVYLTIRAGAMPEVPSCPET